MVNVPSAGSISVADLIGDAVVRVPSDATVATAAEAMAEAGIGAVVVGDQERPVALVSERDAIRVKRAGVLVGIVSARDLLGVYAAEADPVV